MGGVGEEKGAVGLHGGILPQEKALQPIRELADKGQVAPKLGLFYQRETVIMTPNPQDTVDTLVDALAYSGWVVQPGFLSPEEVADLRAEAEQRRIAGNFHRASVGRGEQSQVRGEIRGDHIHWLDEAHAGPASSQALARLETYRQALNRGLYLGLEDLEAHFAVYPPGAGYQRHLDRFRDDDRRTVTVILYLNPPDWGDQDGGHLLFWPVIDAPPMVIPPLGGTLVTFLSERFWHEVTPAQRDRYSLTGWYRRR
jgi:SM-20-related protein